MIVASGFVEAKGLNNLNKVLNELTTRGIEINEINEEKVVFLFERNNIDSLRAELDSLRKIEYINDVYLAYYSLEKSRSGNAPTG
jgi:nitrate reductase NapAB chaperone NapD